MTDRPLGRPQTGLQAKEWGRRGGSTPRTTPLDKVAANPTSLRLAINAKCYDCQGQDTPRLRDLRPPIHDTTDQQPRWRHQHVVPIRDLDQCAGVWTIGQMRCCHRARLSHKCSDG